MLRTEKTTRHQRTSRRFAADEGGIAAIEFALVAPLLITLLLGTMGITQSLWANGKVDHTASIIGDVVAQSTSFTDSDFSDLMDAAPLVMEPFVPESLAVEVTAAVACHQDNGEGNDPTIKYYVRWSQGWEGGNLKNGPQPPNMELKDAPSDLQVADGDMLIVTSVSYSHTPTITHKVGTSIDMKETTYHQPRERKPVLYPTQQAPVVKTCAQLLTSA